MVDAPEAEFSAQAESAGLVLPRERRANPWVAGIFVVGIILASLGIGYATGWLNPRTSSDPYAHPAGCAAPVVQLYGSVPSDSGPELSTALANLSSSYLATSGGCIATAWNASSPSAPLAMLQARQVDFASVDVLPSAADLNASSPGSFVFPALIGSILLVYNLPTFPGPIHLDARALAGIYLGATRNWSSASLTALNPDLSYSGNLTPVFQSTPSAANLAFTDYLSETNTTWARAIGSSTNVPWPAGIAVSDSAAVLAYVGGHPGSLGYVTQNPAVPDGIGVAELENAAGQFTSPNQTGMQNAASALFNSTGPTSPEDWNTSIALYAANWSYPLTTFSYLVVESDLAKAYGTAITPYNAWWLLTYLEWATHGGETIPQSYGYSALPGALTNFSGQVLAEVQYNGTSVLVGGASEAGETGGETGESDPTAPPTVEGVTSAPPVAAPSWGGPFGGWMGTLILLGALGTLDVLVGALVGYPLGAPSLSFAGPGSAVVQAVLSPGFLVLAAAEIVGLSAWRGRTDGRFLAILGAGQAALLLLSPSITGSTDWATASAVAGSGLLVVAFAAILQWIYRNKQLTASSSKYLVGWAIGATAMAAGALTWHLDRTPVPLCAAVVIELGVGLSIALPRRVGVEEERLPWLLNPFWTFQLLLYTFLAEFFVGALLDLEVSGPRFLGFIPFVPIAGAWPNATGTAIYDALWFSAAIMASAWFLVAIGITMGALVVLRIRVTREKPQRYRMGLMLGVYALAAVYLPSLASSTPLAYIPALENLPIIGWGFGLRAGVPFESGVFIAVLVMYASVGVLTLLFGRKALCSVMCGAALMYQGTAINEMRSFNQTSRIGKYFLGSQLSTAYSVASSLALVSLAGVSLLSYLQTLPHVQVANGLIDTAALPLPIELYFGGLWFVMFVSTPYVGTYNCATTGFCHWGSLSVPFAKVGLFRLKVKDRAVCQACTTFDCAKACPVGLVDMPDHFRRTGEYRSTKCCGVGDCVGACPYGNMYHQDVRFWLRRKRTGTDAPPRGTPLPMLRTPSATPVASPSSAPVGASTSRSQ